jgi:CRP-like cAMP-binding protein
MTQPRLSLRDSYVEEPEPESELEPESEPQPQPDPDRGTGAVDPADDPLATPAPTRPLRAGSNSLRGLGKKVVMASKGSKYGLDHVRRVYGHDTDELGDPSVADTDRRRQEDIDAEMSTRRCLARPDSSARQAWDFVQVVLLFYVALMIPFRLGLEVYPGTWSFEWWWEAGVDTFFILDIVINFRTAYWDDLTGNLVISTAEIKKRYLRTWLVPDVVSCLPLSYVLLLVHSGDETAANDASTARVVKIVRLMKLTKMLRLARLARIYQRYEDHFAVLQRCRVYIQVLVLLVAIMYMNHLQCCVWYALGNGPAEQRSKGGATQADGSPAVYVDGWLVRSGYTVDVEGEATALVPVGTRYLASLYWSLTTWTTVGYGDYLAKTNTEKLYACLAQIFGGLMFGILVARMSGIVSRGSLANEKLRNEMEKISEFCRVKNVPLQLRRRIRTFFELLYKQNTVFDNHDVLQHLSPALRREMIDYLYMDVIGQIVLLEYIENSTVMSICTSLRDTVYERGQRVMTEGDDSSDLFIVLSGEIKITRQAVHTGALEAGSFFGEDAICEYYVSGREDGLRTRRTESAESLFYSTLAYLDRETCADIMDSSRQFRINVLQAFTRRHSRGERRVKQIKSLRWRAEACRVEVTVLRAEDLPIMDLDGSTDPYIVACIKDGTKDEQKRTVTKENAGRNAVWGDPLPEDKVTATQTTTGQKLIFPSTMGRMIEIEAWDDDGGISGDDIIGTGRVEVPTPAIDKYAAELEENQVICWVTIKRGKITRGKMSYAGRVLVQIKCWRLSERKSLFSVTRTTTSARLLDRKTQSNKVLLQATTGAARADAAEEAFVSTDPAAEERAAQRIQAVWRGKLARRRLKVSKHEEQIWTKREAGNQKTMSTHQARTDRQKVVDRRMQLNNRLFDRVNKRLVQEIEAQIEEEEQEDKHSIAAARRSRLTEAKAHTAPRTEPEPEPELEPQPEPQTEQKTEMEPEPGQAGLQRLEEGGDENALVLKGRETGLSTDELRRKAEVEAELTKRLKEMAERQDRVRQTVDSAETTMEALVARLVSVQNNLTLRRRQRLVPQTCAPTTGSTAADGEESSDNTTAADTNTRQQDDGEAPQLPRTVLIPPPPRPPLHGKHEQARALLRS